MSEALRVINSEHRSMWRLLAALELVAKELEHGKSPPDADFFGLAFDYMESYVDRVHRPKEEQYLYRVLRERAHVGLPLLDELEREHREGMERLARLRQALLRFSRDFPEGRAEFSEGLADFIRMAQNHIKKEEGRIIPMARKMLKEADWTAIDAAFTDAANPLFGESAQAEFRNLWTRIVNLAPDPIGLGLAHEHEAAPVPVEAEAPLLEIEELASHYGRIQALKGVTLTIEEGQLVALVGANGAGKTTLLRTISGVQRATGGHVLFRGQDITKLRADKRVRLGICQVPEGRQVFGPLSVEDNIRLGAYTRPKAEAAEDMERMYRMFPILKQKRAQPAGTLSGGQQQMLAIARALMGRPKLLLLDEPSMGLAPLLVEEIFNAIVELKRQGMTIFLVEQNAYAALSIADVGYVLETGQTVLCGPGRELLENEQVKQAYLGM
ncbi:MAG: ATP-binding cassette domain-containing protein [Betaproteobacteria bacterium]|nr:ATP-binding cassette domain-containing protein [Betaproteobacteria bacterium]